jgi:hypothetical protein
MGAYLLMFPRARVTSLMWISPFSWMSWATGTWGLVYRNISAFWFVGSWVVFQFMLAGLASTREEQGPYGVYAHAAGAVCGMLLIYVARIPERMPAADHPSRSGELSAPLIGDEGDAGDGYIDPTPQMLEEQWRRSPEGRLQQRILELRAPFDDRFAEDMLARGDWSGARAHCEQMLELAQQAQNEARIAGYTQLLQRIRAEAGPSASRPAIPVPPPLPADAARIPHAADPFGLGDAPRGTRRG